nr:hypothetical protein [Halothermothrix orenii]
MKINKLQYRHLKQKIAFSFFGLTLFIALGILALIILFIFKRGLAVVNWEFITQMPRNGMTEGGILPAILGSFYLVSGAIIFAAPLGVFAAI